jgi:murein DD-endopeptidase MepM/ murein hydrolase activator NlpD
MDLSKSYSIIVVPGDHSGTRQYQVSAKLLVTLGGLAALLLITVGFFVVTYGGVLNEARRVDDLEEENAMLRSQVLMVNQLNEELESITALRAQITNMLGLQTDDDEVGEGGPGEMPLLATLDSERIDHLRAAEILETFSPTQWPVAGRVAREFAPGSHGDRGHPGLGIQAPSGAPITASGRGRVLETGYDDAIGNYVILDHGFGFHSLYGQTDRILVVKDQMVDRGQIIAYLGTSDPENGAQLYFEIQLDGEPVDPRQYLSPQR